MTPFEQTCFGLEKSSKPDSERLQELFRVEWEYTMKEYPEFATQVGHPGLNNRWTDLSTEAVARRKREVQAPLKALLSIKRDNLAREEQLSYDLFRHNYEMAIEEARFPSECLRITHIEGVQQSLFQILDAMPKFTVRDFQDFVARLNSFGVLVDQTTALLEKGLASGVTTPKIALGYVLQQIDNLLAPGVEENPVLKLINDFPSSLPENDIKELRQAAAEALRNNALPAMRRLRAFMAGNYMPNARETIAMKDLPDGGDWYEFTVRHLTTTRLSPREIHDMGLSEVSRIHREMDKAIEDSGFQGSCPEFLDYLRTEPNFFYKRAEDLLTGYRDVCKRAEPELVKIFGLLPRQTYGVKPIPEYFAKSQPAAFYQPGSLKAGRPGFFLVNTSELRSRPKWEMETLTLHEAVPGHHLQIALADEIENVPEFRKHAFYGAYIEGWALYAESLGYEMGFFRDIYSRFGQLTNEMWRAVRLVVDTGIHALGWSRQQAIDYFFENAASSMHNAIVEIDRYIVLPGQALTYKTGQLKIRNLREWAERKLDSRFDLRSFHDEVLRHGAIPLDVLEDIIKKWAA